LYVSTKLTSYWTQKKVSYSVQPTMQKMIGEVQKCQKVTKYVYKFGPFVWWCVIVTSMKISKINNKKICLNLNLKHKTKGSKLKHNNKNQEHVVCKIKVQTKFLLEWNKQM
jgi:hypothetical protein